MKCYILALLLYTISFVLPCTFAFSQSYPVDSLKLKIQQADNDTTIAELYRQIANQYLQIDSDSALHYSKKLVAFSGERELISYQIAGYRSMGFAHILFGNYQNARESFNKGIETAQNNQDTISIAASYGNIGNTYMYEENYKSAIHYFKKALVLFEAKKHTPGIATCYGTIGNLYITLDNDSLALINYKKSLEYFRKLHNKQYIALSLMNMGLIYKRRDNFMEALKHYLDAYTLFKELDLKLQMAQCESNTGSCFLELGEYSEAMKHIKKSIEVFEDLDVKKELVIAYKNMGNVYDSLQQYENARKWYFKSLENAEAIANVSYRADNYTYLYKNYKATRNYKEALKYFELLFHIEDSLFKAKHNKELDELLTKYETEQKQKEITILKKDNRIKNLELTKQKQLKNFFITGAAFLLLLVVLVFTGYRMKRKANIQLAAQKKIIENKNESIMASINYASRIQAALLPSDKAIAQIFGEYFILYRPRDVVSGDFYWIRQYDSLVFIAIADCTGHGVPGAFMSLLGISYLNDIIRKDQSIHAARILEKLRQEVKSSLKQTITDGSSTKDGMDMAFCILNLQDLTLQYAGAYNPLYIFRKAEPDDEFLEYKATRNPVGVHLKEKEFKNHTIQLQKTDTLYMFSDGFVDQTCGKEKKKIKSSNFKKILRQIQPLSMDEQKAELEKHLNNCLTDNEQIDDVLIAGIRI